MKRKIFESMQPIFYFSLGFSTRKEGIIVEGKLKLQQVNIIFKLFICDT